MGFWGFGVLGLLVVLVVVVVVVVGQPSLWLTFLVRVQGSITDATRDGSSSEPSLGSPP